MASVGRLILIASVAGAAVIASSAEAKPPKNTHYDIPSQSLDAALRQVGRSAGIAIMFKPEDVAGLSAPSLRGDYSVTQALDLLLAGTRLTAKNAAGTIVIRGRSSPPRPELTDAAAISDDVVVTGSRIRGAKSASAVAVIDREAMKDSGRTNVTDVARTIPQNFGGGQSPGIGLNVPTSSGQDAGGGTAINLRGLGSAATLTLLNGHRLAYSGYAQGIDVSAIPFGAIDRIEVVPDGASTIYGSDAVAGVVNVILRQRFEGLETTAKVGGSTDGGNLEQQYDAVTGIGWRSGNAFLAYEFDRNTPIISDQRDYAASVRPGLTLYPGMRRNNLAGEVRQAITPALSFSLDGLFNARSSSTTYPLNAAGDLSVSGGTSSYSTQTFTVAPSLELALPSNWQVTLSASYGGDTVNYAGTYYFGATRGSSGSGFFRNRGETVELSGSGDLIRLPGGTAKLALGGGYRRNTFERFAGTGNANNVDRAQESDYAFGELSVPILPKVLASAALRYEHYPSIGSVATPKLGLILSPVPDLDLKGSWGRSFRAPSLNQQFAPTILYLAPASQFGGNAYPAGSTVLYNTGGNVSLKPERSSNWSVTVDLHPRAVERLDVQISYFSIDYADRIVTPILFPTASLSDPSNAAYLTAAPSVAAQSALIASAGTFTNLVGAYDPTQVVAIIANNSVNAGKQQAHGIDAEMRYKLVAGGSTVGALITASYLTSKQQITASQPVTQLAGILFNPPKFRGRGELSWAHGGFGVVADVNLIGPVQDTRVAGQSLHVAGMTPVDLTLRYRTSSVHGLLSGVEFILSAQNIFDEAPAPIATSVYVDTPYDSTNYSAFGRVVSLSVSKRW